MKVNIDKANQQVQNLESELKEISHYLTTEKQLRKQDLEHFIVESSKLKQELEYLQLKYDQEIEHHSTEVRDIFNSFAFEKESLIQEFAEEHKTEILELQKRIGDENQFSYKIILKE